MAKVGIVTDTNSGIPVDLAKKYEIHLQPMPFYIDGELKYEGEDFTQKDFFKALKQDKDVSTSMPIVGDLMGFWEELLLVYDELVYIPMSSGLSSSYETASLLAKDYDGRVFVADTHRISVTMMVAAIEASMLAKDGKSGQEIKDYLEKTGMEASIYIMVDTLKYLRKGGRLTPAVAAIGTILKIKPVLQIQGEKLDTFAKVRTLKQGKQVIIDALKADLENRFNDPEAKNCLIAIAHTDNDKEAEIFREELLEVFPDNDIRFYPLSISIACHTGAGALAAGVMKTFIKEI